jgi:hypothetical protein
MVKEEKEMFKSTLYPALLKAAAVYVITFLFVPWAQAVTFTVDSVEDLPDDGAIPGSCHTAAHTCTLRAAVMQANRSNGIDATIVLPAGLYKLTIQAAGGNGEENGDLNLTPPLVGNPVITIIGAGSAATIIEGSHNDRLISISAGRTASLNGVALRKGKTAQVAGGGGILNAGTLTINDCRISGNQVDSGGGGGGGILNAGTLSVANSTISENISNWGGGGGLANMAGGSGTIAGTLVSGNQDLWVGAGGGCGLRNLGTLTVTDSTISGNVAFNGGGVYNYPSGTLTVINSTISGNAASSHGGGIYSYHNLGPPESLIVINSTVSGNNANTDGGGIYNGSGTASVYNATIVFNMADADADPGGGSAGGVYNNPGATFNLRNTLVALNMAHNAPYYDDCTGTLTALGRDLFWSVIGCTITPAGKNWGYLNDPSTLGPLANNGGPTWTHMLLPGNFAIDLGDPVEGCVGPGSVPLTTDQRGKPRPVGLACDIGAVERQTADTFYLLKVNPSGKGSGTVSGNGINCTWNGKDLNGACSVTISANTPVSLNVSPAYGSIFSGWMGGTGSASGCSGTGACEFKISEASEIDLSLDSGFWIYLPLILR